MRAMLLMVLLCVQGSLGSPRPRIVNCAATAARRTGSPGFDDLAQGDGSVSERASRNLLECPVADVRQNEQAFPAAPCDTTEVRVMPSEAWITFNSGTGRIELRPGSSVSTGLHPYTCVRPGNPGGDLSCFAMVLSQTVTTSSFTGNLIENVLPVDGILTVDGNLV